MLFVLHAHLSELVCGPIVAKGLLLLRSFPCEAANRGRRPRLAILRALETYLSILLKQCIGNNSCVGRVRPGRLHA